MMTAEPSIFLRMENVRKTFRTPSGEPVAVLRDVNLQLRRGAFGVVTGPSGSGKTTLLMIAGLLQTFDEGRFQLDGVDIGRLAEKEITRLRQTAVGMVFQKFCLMPNRNVLENVQFRFRYLSVPAREIRERSMEALRQVGLADKAKQAARLLSAGEMQRAAIARALALPPKLLLADEPTGNLDDASATRVMELFHRLNESGMTLLLVTHNPAWLSGRTVHWTMHGGALASAG